MIRCDKRLAATVLLAGLCVVWSGREAKAQNPPARLPTVVVNAAPDLPGARKVAAVVRDTTGFPIEGVEVSITSLQRRMLSGPDGTVRFDDVKPGTYSARARKLGFAPQIQTLVVDGRGGAVAFSLLPVPYALRPVVSSASRGGLSGVVGDTAFNPIPGATVHLLGHTERTLTDSAGAFFIDAQPGSYLVSVTQSGFDHKLVSVIIPPDSGRRITVYLPPETKTSIRHAHALDDLNDRIAGQKVGYTKVFTRAELEQQKIEWAYDAVRMGFGQVNRNSKNGWVDADCAAVVNGGPEYVEIGTLTVDQIESVEVYTPANNGPARAPVGRGNSVIVRPPSHGSQLPIPLNNLEQATWANRTKNCPIVYVWLR